MSAVLEHAHHATATFTITEVSHAAALLSLRDALIRESHAIVKSSVEHGWERLPPSHQSNGHYNGDPDKASPARWSGGSSVTLLAHLMNSAGQRLTCHCIVTVTEARWFQAVNSSGLSHATRDALRASSYNQLTPKQLEAWREISWRFTRVAPLDVMSL